MSSKVFAVVCTRYKEPYIDMTPTTWIDSIHSTSEGAYEKASKLEKRRECHEADVQSFVVMEPKKARKKAVA